METKSRYEVISELEEKKRSYIKERDELDFEVKSKERNVVNLKRTKADIEAQKRDFDLKEANAREDLERKRKDFEFRLGNTEVNLDRQIEDAEEDIQNFKATVEKRKETLNELIKSVDASLERFGKLHEKK